jgi:hypothetical protein
MAVPTTPPTRWLTPARETEANVIFPPKDAVRLRPIPAITGHVCFRIASYRNPTRRNYEVPLNSSESWSASKGRPFDRIIRGSFPQYAICKPIVSSSLNLGLRWR